MSKNNSEHTWIEAGYNQFAAEGLEGLQVERLARITGLNKAGYYHYFGNQETFLEKLMEHHLLVTISHTNELKQVQQLDPEYIELLIKYTTPVMFNSQLVRHQHNQLLSSTYKQVNEMTSPVVSQLFADFIGFHDHVEFSAKYFSQVRLMFHAKITFDRMNYPYMRDLLYEARGVIQQAIEIAAKN